MKLLFCQFLLIISLNIDLFECSTCCKAKRKDIYQQLYNATERTLSTLTPPLCYQIILNQSNVESQYISATGLIGRIIPVGTFETRDLALEYLYGLVCPIPGLPTPTNVLQSVELVHISYNKEYFITDSEFIFTLTNGKRLTFFVHAAFDEQYKLCAYDGVIRHIGLTLDANTDEGHTSNINALCAATQSLCTGELQQYNSTEDCIQFLTTQVPYGSFDRADQGNVICRLIHIKFVPLFPSVHCPHVGPTGGGKCVNKTIGYYYDQPNFLACAHRYACS